jgi:hypothetical protein
MGTLYLKNSILANSTGYDDCYNSGTFAANINNLIETTGTNLNSCGTALLTGDPVLGPLASNGGLTQTMALQSGSPAIDTAAGGYCPATDQRGVARPQGNGCDIGAFEYVTTNVTPTATPPYSYQPLYLSLTGSQTIGGVSAADEDILRFDGQTWSLFFDGSDVGLGAVDLFAFSVADASTIMMSVSASVTVQGIPVTPQDILLFQATSLGSNTAGTFSMMFDGSDVGLTTTDERIDSVSFLPDRRILISTTGSPAVTGISTGRDEDVLAFLPVTLGDATSGTWSMYFDGSDVGLADTSGEDVDALDVQGGNVYLSTTDNFSVSGLSGADEDVFICASTSVGDTTSCNYSPSLYFDGSTWGLSANDVDAINLLTSGAIPTAVPTNTPTPTLSPTPTPSPPMAAFDVKILSHEPNPSNAGQTVTVTVSVTDFGGGPAGSQLVTIVSDEGSTSCTTSQTTSTCSGQLTFNNPYGHLIRASVGGSYAEVDHYVNPPVTGTLTYTPTPTATPGGTNAMFADGFESGTLSAWTSSSTDAGDLSVSPAAALVGGQGLQAVIDDVNVLSLTSDHPNAEPHYLAGFYFDPNSITMANGDAHIILRGYSGSSTVALRMEFGYSAGGYQLRTGLVNDGTTWTETSWFTLSDAPHLIQVDWRAASGAGTNNGGLVLWIDGVQSQLLSGIDNDTRRIDRVLLGALAGVDTGTRGTYYFDVFESQR